MQGENQSDETQFALIFAELATIQATLKTILTKLDRDYVTQDQFKPVKSLVYGITGLMLTALVGAIVKLVLK